MRTVEQWFGEYGESHSNPRNELLHIICVPPIVMTVIGFLWSIPVPAAIAEISEWLNFATLFVAAAVVYYFALSISLGSVRCYSSSTGWTPCHGRCGSPAW
jgi:uncharacterized membrane protein YGL010W